MVAPCCYCGIPLQRATQYIAIADIIIGVLQCSLVAVQLAYANEAPLSMKEDNVYDPYHYEDRSSSYRHHSIHRRRSRTFLPVVDRFPYGIVVALVVCHAIQLVMGVLLYVAAVNKHRGTLIFWMIMTAFTAAFTFLILRIYEMIIVNEFARELKAEYEVSYFHDQIQPQPYSSHYGNAPPPNQLVPPIEPCTTSINVISGNGGGFSYNSGLPSAMGTVGIDGYGLQPGYPIPTGQQQIQYQFDNQNIPAALQPPPRYEEVVKQPPYNTNFSGAGGLQQGFANPQFPSAGPSTSALANPNANALPRNQMFQEAGGFSQSFSKF